MCEPATIAMLTMAAVGTSISAYSAVAAGENAKEAGEYNAKIGEMKALDSLQRGADDAASVRDRARRVASAQIEGSAMSGVDVNSGTPLSLLTETAGLGELDARRALNNAQREAWGFTSQAKLDRFSGQAAGNAGILNGAGTLINGASNTYYSGRKAGMWGGK